MLSNMIWILLIHFIIVCHSFLILSYFTSISTLPTQHITNSLCVNSSHICAVHFLLSHNFHIPFRPFDYHPTTARIRGIISELAEGPVEWHWQFLDDSSYRQKKPMLVFPGARAGILNNVSCSKNIHLSWRHGIFHCTKVSSSLWCPIWKLLACF